ncbi:MAG TPA: helix-turn-helix transcriptional regulator, partial [Acetobacteraceae bacterium]|nr:helix-turn-helix transcriptional regulator [Acetobacteraceae bacterium]
RVAEQLGVSYQQINKYETGRNALTCLALLELASVLQVPAGWLIGDADSDAVAAWPVAMPDKLQARLLLAFSRIANDYRRVVAVHAVEALASVPAEPDFTTASGGAA